MHGRTERDLLDEAAAALPDLARSVSFPPPPEATMATLGEILAAWPVDVPLPRLASDDEGCALVRCVRADGRVVALTVEGTTVHATIDPGCASRHLPPFEWGPDRRGELEAVLAGPA
jgi:hypothetical protein